MFITKVPLEMTEVELPVGLRVELIDLWWRFSQMLAANSVAVMIVMIAQLKTTSVKKGDCANPFCSLRAMLPRTHFLLAIES